MGGHDMWPEAGTQSRGGLLLNGLVPVEGDSVIRELDAERWAKAEDMTAELIKRIQPNKPSENRRNAVANYVKRLVMQCFPCQVFTFGSVPLKTYLPDGDIDLTAFSDNPNLKDTWAHQVRDVLEYEEKNENAEFRVKEVQYIQAEVKIIKCLVENIVVDISFQQLGGLCTLCFLEEVDNLINNDHLFKRSIILIKAWCYYESRILGAHHGLISTYALETLVLYIFHVFNSKFAGPLEVLYRFLEFFSKFDWDNFCVSLWGPVPIRSLPDVTAEPPRNDGGEPLLSKVFLDACSTVYASYPLGQEIPGQRFTLKHFNVIDPLRATNNLGRSVSKGNFFRIRSAFTFGAKKLAGLLKCRKEDIHTELNQFFMNTLERHSSGHRPDAPKNDGRTHLSENLSSSRIESSACESSVHITHGSHRLPSQNNSYASESSISSSELATVSRTQTQKNYPSLKDARFSDKMSKDHDSRRDIEADKIQRSSKPNNVVGELPGRYLFVRTHSSPELTETYGEVSSQGNHNRSDAGNGQTYSARLDSNRRKNSEFEHVALHSVRSSSDDPSSGRHVSSNQNHDMAADSSSHANSYRDGSSLGALLEDFDSPLGTQAMSRKDQELASMVDSSGGLGFNGQVNTPLNMAASHMYLPIPSSMLASMEYAERNLPAMLPTNFPLAGAPWAANMQYLQGSVPSPFNHYYPGMGFTSNFEDSVEDGNGNSGSGEINHVLAEHDLWIEQDGGSSGDADLESGKFEMHLRLDKDQSTSDVFNSVPSSLTDTAGSSTRVLQKFMKENQGLLGDDHVDNLPYQENQHTEVQSDDKIVGSRSFSTLHSGSVRSKTSSESSWEGSSAKVAKPAREKRGRKKASAVYGKGKSVSEHSSKQTDDDDKDWNELMTTATEMIERIGAPQSSASSPVSRHEFVGLEPTQASGSEPLLPFGPVILKPASQQRTDNTGVVPFTFYPTGPPVPFVTMLPFYNFPSEAGTPDASNNQFGGEDGADNSDCAKKLDLAERDSKVELLSRSASTRTAFVGPLEHKSDILNGDFVSHWHNLLYGRFCQNSRNPSSPVYPLPPMVPPGHLQSHYPWDGPGRPLTNVNTFNQLISHGPHLVPAAALNRPAGVYQQYADEMPRYRSGTGTYLPNPKVAARERYSMNTRKGSYNYDRSDHHSNREGNWNLTAKSRGMGRSHNRGLSEKSSSRPHRFAASESRSDRSWSSHRHDPLPSYQSLNGAVRSDPTQNSSGNVAFGMYPLQTMHAGALSSNGSTVPSVVMVYPFDHHVAGFGAAEKLEFGSFGPMSFAGMKGPVPFKDTNRLSGGFDDRSFHGTSAQRSSPDEPSSPHVQR